MPSKNRVLVKTTRRFGTPAMQPVPTPFAHGAALATAQEDSAPLDTATVDQLARDSMRVAAAADAQTAAAPPLDIFTVEERRGEQQPRQQRGGIAVAR